MKEEWLETGYVFTQRELAVLLSVAGCGCLYGFSLAGRQEIDKVALLRELHSLFQKGILRKKVGNEKLEIDPAVFSLLSICAYSKRVLRIWSLDPEQAPFAACYPGQGGWTIMRPCVQMLDGWLLERRDTAGMLCMLEDNSLLPHGDEALQQEQEKLLGYGREEKEPAIPLSRFEWIDGQNGELIAQMTISRGILTDWLHAGAKKQPYTAERFTRWVTI